MSTPEAAGSSHEPGRLTRMLSAITPHPLRQQAQQQISALGSGLDAFADRYVLDRESNTMAGLNAADAHPVLGDTELVERLRVMVEQAREYLHQLEGGKLPQEIPEFAELVAELEDTEASSAAGLAARAELAGLLRKIDKLDNHWLAEARRNRRQGRQGRTPRVGRDANQDNIDDSVQRRPQPAPTPVPHRPDHEVSELDLKLILARAAAAQRRDEMADRAERERLEAEQARRDRGDDDLDPDSSVEFWGRYGEEITLLLVALGYVGEDAQILGTSRAAELMKLPAGVPPIELLERLRGEFEGRYLPIDADYDPRLVHAIAAGMPVADAIALNERDLLDDDGQPELQAAIVIDSGVRVQAARQSFGTPMGVATRAPWQPVDPAEIARENRFGPDAA